MVGETGCRVQDYPTVSGGEIPTHREGVGNGVFQSWRWSLLCSVIELWTGPSRLGWLAKWALRLTVGLGLKLGSCAADSAQTPGRSKMIVEGNSAPTGIPGGAAPT